MRLDLKIDRDLAFGQALSIYHIIKKELLKFSEEQLSSAQETTLKESDETSELNQLTNGAAVADLVVYAFPNDIALHWEFIQT